MNVLVARRETIYSRLLEVYEDSKLAEEFVDLIGQKVNFDGEMESHKLMEVAGEILDIKIGEASLGSKFTLVYFVHDILVWRRLTPEDISGGRKFLRYD